MNREDNSRTFVFGAGVSKAVAGAPVMKELFLKMKERYEHEKKRSDCPQGNNRIMWFNMLQVFIKKLEMEARKRFGQIEKRQHVKITNTVRENVEYLITLLDIHTDYGAMFEFKEFGADWSPYPFIPLANIGGEEMEEIRGHLATYLYLCLGGLDDNNGILSKFFGEQLKPNDHIITFNYDLLIERTLWRINQWGPIGGYVGVKQLEKKEDKEDLIGAERGRSAHKILKLHGSINWQWEYPSLQPKVNPVISLDNWEKWDFIFPELKDILRRNPTQPTGRGEALISKGYTGGYFPAWILPSYIKTFNKNPFLIKIWREAQKILAHARWLVVLGYSLPEQDSQSQLLLASLPDDCTVLIVDPEGDAIKKRMNSILRSPDISVKNMGFEEWVKKGCPGLEELGNTSV